MAYKWLGMRKIPWEEIKKIHEEQGLQGYYKLYDDDSESLIEDYSWEEIEEHYIKGGEFGEEMDTVELQLAGGKKITVPEVVDISEQGCLEDLEYSLWNTIEEYLMRLGIGTEDDEPDMETVREVQNHILSLLMDAGVHFKLFSEETQEKMEEILHNNENSEKVIKVELEIVLSREDIDDIMAGALEGGISYWCKKAVVVGEYLGEYASEQIARGGALDLYDFESEAVYRLTPEKFLKGVELWAKKPVGCNCMEQIGGKLKIDCCNADAIVCDAIIQYAIFEDVIYG